MAENSTPRFHLDRRASRLEPILANDDDMLLTSAEVAELLGVSHSWMEARRRNNDGPPFRKIGPRLLRYRLGDVRAWLRERAAAA